MIINPRLLFPETDQYAKWEYIDYYYGHQSYVIEMACDCKRKPICSFADMDKILQNDSTRTRVQLKPEQFSDKKKHTVIIYQGQCVECKTIYWTCDSLQWIGWLTDKQQLETILSAVPIRHILIDSWGILVQKDTPVRFTKQGGILTRQ